MFTPEQLCERMASVIDEMRKVSMEGKDDWVYLSSLGAKAKAAEVLFQDYGAETFNDFIKCFSGLELFRDDSNANPVVYVRKNGPLSFSSKKEEDSPASRVIPQLAEWAYLGDYLATYEDLCQLALDEDWGDFEDDMGRIHHPILENYLNYTFQKLFLDEGIRFSSDKRFAAFNTGLVDCRYLPIYALFDKYAGYKKWHLIGFCISGENKAGKTLNAEFEKMPPLAKYFNSINDLLFDTTKGLPALDVEHIILERTWRLPAEFVKAHPPKDFELKDVDQLKQLDREQRESYYTSLSEAISADQDTYRAYSTALHNALSVAIKRVQWNYKSAIPMYYPKRKKMCLFLPLSLVRDNKVDLALVVERTNSGRYQGATVYQLEWAYKCARLICRPDTDWLTPNNKDQEIETE